MHQGHEGRIVWAHRAFSSSKERERAAEHSQCPKSSENLTEKEHRRVKSSYVCRWNTREENSRDHPIEDSRRTRPETLSRCGHRGNCALIILSLCCISRESRPGYIKMER